MAASFIYSVFNPRDFSGNFQDGERGITYRQQMPSLYGNLPGVHKTMAIGRCRAGWKPEH